MGIDIQMDILGLKGQCVNRMYDALDSTPKCNRGYAE